MKMSAGELKGRLARHASWRAGDPKGKRLVLTGGNLECADMRGANLTDADLTGADLRRANMRDANLANANLAGADLANADMTNANLANANLANANLANANLGCANLTGADLFRANLANANLTGATLPDYRILPTEGTIIGWKKLHNGVICELQIDAATAVCSLIGRKCRAPRAVVLSGHGKSIHDPCFVYAPGPVESRGFSGDIRVECRPGIHFFLTRQEAEAYEG